MENKHYNDFLKNCFSGISGNFKTCLKKQQKFFLIEKTAICFFGMKKNLQKIEKTAKKKFEKTAKNKYQKNSKFAVFSICCFFKRAVFFILLFFEFAVFSNEKLLFFVRIPKSAMKTC